MGFLTKRKGLDKREAREVLDLAELLDECARSGPVPLERYARIRRCEGKIESHERNARALVARLRALGFVLATEGDAERLTIDFGRDEALRSHVVRVEDEASRVLGVTRKNDPDGNDSQQIDGRALLEAVERDYEAGLTVGGIVSRYGLRTERARLFVQAVTEPRRPGRRRIEEDRCAEILKLAMEDPRGVHGHVSRVARILGCHRDTARALLKRVARGYEKP